MRRCVEEAHSILKDIKDAFLQLLAKLYHLRLFAFDNDLPDLLESLDKIDDDIRYAFNELNKLIRVYGERIGGEKSGRKKGPTS